MITIYKPSEKGLRSRRAKMSPNDRFIIQNGHALWFKTTGEIQQTDLLYRRPDSHVIVTNETLENYKFTISESERNHAKRYDLWVPPTV